MNNIELKNKEVVLKEVKAETEENPMFAKIATDIDSLLEYEIIAVGAKCENYKDGVGKFVLCRNDYAKAVKNDLFKGLKVALNEDLIFCELKK